MFGTEIFTFLHVFIVFTRLALQEGRLTPPVFESIKKYTKGFAHGEYFLSRNWYFSRKLDVLSLPGKNIWIKSGASSILKLEIVIQNPCRFGHFGEIPLLNCDGF